MHFIRLAIISFILIFILFTLISLLFPSHIRISRAVDIHHSRDTVIEYIRQSERWKLWYPGADSLSLLVIDGKPQGLILDESSQAGLRITESNDSMVVARTIGPSVKRQLTTTWEILSASHTRVVTVRWYMDFKLRWYPWEKFSSLFYEDIYGTELENGLTRLKQAVEKTTRQ